MRTLGVSDDQNVSCIPLSVLRNRKESMGFNLIRSRVFGIVWYFFIATRRGSEARSWNNLCTPAIRRVELSKEHGL